MHQASRRPSRLALAALVALTLAAALAPAAQAQSVVAPLNNHTYLCNVYGDPYQYAYVSFNLTGNNAIKRGQTTVLPTNAPAFTRKSVIAKPVAIYGGTEWEYTEPIEQHQCKAFDVLNGGQVVIFDQCDTGEYRICWAL